MIGYPAQSASRLALPLYACTVAAGFPSPAEDHLDKALDIHKFLIKRPSSTYFALHQDETMATVGIFSGDLLMIDQSLRPSHGDIVHALHEGESLFRFLDTRAKRLLAADMWCAPLNLQEDSTLDVRGVVTASVRHLHKGFVKKTERGLSEALDLNRYLVAHPPATYYVRASGESLMGLGVFDGDLLVVDRSLTAVHGDVIVVALDGQLSCKVLDSQEGCLLAANAGYPAITLQGYESLEAEGVVTAAVRMHHALPG